MGQEVERNAAEITRESDKAQGVPIDTFRGLVSNALVERLYEDCYAEILSAARALKEGQERMCDYVLGTGLYPFESFSGEYLGESDVMSAFWQTRVAHLTGDAYGPDRARSAYANLLRELSAKGFGATQQMTNRREAKADAVLRITWP